MRTTVELDDDTAKAVDQVRRRDGVGTSEAINTLLRRAMLMEEAPAKPFVQRTASLGLRVDVSNIGEVLETLDGPSAS